MRELSKGAGVRRGSGEVEERGEKKKVRSEGVCEWEEEHDFRKVFDDLN